MSKKLKDQLVKLGSKRKDLRPHIRPVLAVLKNAGSLKREGEVEIELNRGSEMDVVVDVRAESSISGEIYESDFDDLVSECRGAIYDGLTIVKDKMFHLSRDRGWDIKNRPTSGLQVELEKNTLVMFNTWDFVILDRNETMDEAQVETLTEHLNKLLKSNGF